MSEWRECSLGEILTLKRGYDLPKQLRNDGDVPIFSSSGISGFHDESKVKGVGVILGRYGTIGKIFLSINDFWPLNTTLYVENFNGNDKFFIFYLLQTIDWEKFNDKSAVPGINRNDVHQEIAFIPTLPEQKAIASVLSSLDDKIDLLHRQNKTLEAMAEALFRQWFIEEAQDDWEEVELGSAIETTSGGTPSRDVSEYYDIGIYNWVKSKELNRSYIFETEEKISDLGLKKSSAKLFPKNTVLIAMYGATVGEYAITANQMACNQAVCAVKPNANYPYTFLFMFFNKMNEEIINMAVGSAQQNISQALIKQLPVPSCYDRINKFHRNTEKLFEKIKLNCMQICTLEKLRDNLLPKLMSGEVRVNYE